jgi:hypothetical protein
VDKELDLHDIDGEIAKAGALFGTTMEKALEAHLGRPAKLEEMTDFAVGAIDIIFSATYALVQSKGNRQTAHSWAEAVMQCVSDSVKTITDQDFKIIVVSKDSPASG